jgi:hypothetical protein
MLERSKIARWQVSELTHSVDINLNEPVSLQRADEILSSMQSCGLAGPTRWPCTYRAIRGRRIVQYGGPAQCEPDQDRKA